MEDRTKRRARLVLILGAALALIASLTAYALVSGASAPAAPAIPTVPVVVAARELPARTALAEADLRVARYNEGTAPAAALKDTKDLVGKVLTVPLALGEPVLPTKFAAANAPTFTVFPPGQSVTPGQALPPNTPNYRALSISVPDPNAVGGVLQPGDLVDIVYTFNLDPTKYLRTGGSPDRTSDFTAKVLLQNVPILARKESVYTIRTDAETAERLAYLAAAGGTLQLLLRAGGDQRTVTTTGATFQVVFDQFRFKIPERFSP